MKTPQLNMTLLTCIRPHGFLLSLMVFCTTACVSGDAGLASNSTLSLMNELSDPSGRVMVAAHRGCWADAPENSRAALEACAQLGVDIVEIDLRMTADGEIVIMHDSSFRRMSGDERRVSEMTLEEVRSLRLRNRDGRASQELTPEGVPTFREIIRTNDRRMLLILDLKSDPAILAPAAARILREEGACDIAMFALVAPPDQVRNVAGPLLDCASYLPNLRVPMGLMSDVAEGYAMLKPVAVAVRFDDWAYLYEGADDVRRMPARLWVNTLDPIHAAGLTDADALTDPEALWGRLVDVGVNMIQTDEPQALLNFLAQRRSRADQLMRNGHDPLSSYVMVEAHRGAWSGVVPENSLSALDRAITLGADLVEIDVRLTRDGQVILMHDSTLDRTTSLTGRVDETDAAVILGSYLRRPDGQLTSEHPMLLRDALPILRGRILVRLDVKCRPHCYEPVFNLLLNENFTDQLVVYEEALPFLAGARLTNEDILVIGRQVYEYGDPAAVPAFIDIVQFKDFDAGAPPLDVVQRFVNTHRIVAAPYNDRRAGLRGDEASVTEPHAGWGWLVEAGADILLTDETDHLIPFLEANGRRAASEAR